VSLRRREPWTRRRRLWIRPRRRSIRRKPNLDLLDTQIAKLVVYAPLDGEILTRNVEPGEFVQPGAVTFSMADLSNMTITVYVPEDRYGQISLGQPADVRVDSFPGETFAAEVIHIADQAEFTPRNVQTVEGRSSTVYAIRLKVTDSQGKLKIGMPADVVFK
jgi:HlyD family secretion protein